MARRWRVVAVAAIAAIVLCVGFAVLLRWRVARTLTASEREVAQQQDFPFEVRRLSASSSSPFEWISAPAVFRHGAVYKGHLFLCGPAGLYEYSPEGILLKHYRPGIEIPEAPLVTMIKATLSHAREPELLIATDGEGVLAFDGASFLQIRPRDAEARKVTSLLAGATGQLLLGTMKKGVLAYDGEHLAYFHSTLKDIYVTALAGSDTDLWVGTLAHGALHWRGGETAAIGEEQGLPDGRVESIAVDGNRVYIGTPVGTAELVDGRMARSLAEGVFAKAFYPAGDRLLIGSMDQGIVDVSLHATRIGSHRSFANANAVDDLAAGSIEQFFRADDVVKTPNPDGMVDSGGMLYALAQDGLYGLRSQGSGWRRVLDRSASQLSDLNVSALAIDNQQRLWVGYFDRGIDVLAPDGHQLKHFEDAHVYCINRILPDNGSRGIAVGTANGLVMFDDSALVERRVLDKSAGLIAEHVTDVALYRDGMAVATPAGLTFLDRSGAHSVYAFQGLVNNHVYALGISGNRLLAGTLGGLSELDNDSVRRNFTTATSGLKHNWITAIVPVDDGWFIGTYGAGVVRMDAQGRFDAMDVTTPGVEVNPNAMLVTGQHVLAGTLGSGLLVYNRSSKRWTTVTAGLPSSNVTAMAASGGSVYVGTDNGLVRIEEQQLDR